MVNGNSGRVTVGMKPVCMKPWTILKTFWNFSLVHLLRCSQEVAQCSLLPSVTPNSWVIKCDTLLVILWSSETPRHWLHLQKGRAEPQATSASIFGSGIFALLWQKQVTEGRYLVSPSWPAFLSSWGLTVVFHSCHPNFHLHRYSVYLRYHSSKEELQAYEKYFLEITMSNISLEVKVQIVM